VQIYDPVIKLYRFVFKEKDVQCVIQSAFSVSFVYFSRYSTKLRALSDAQVVDFGALLAVAPVESSLQSISTDSGQRLTSIGSRQSFYSAELRDSYSGTDSLGLGDFLREVEAHGAVALEHQSAMLLEESSETKELTSEQ
jgi:hypothetical protein